MIQSGGFLGRLLCPLLKTGLPLMKERGFLGMLLGMLGASLLGNILASIGIKRAGEGFIRAGYRSSIKSKDF